MSGKGQARVEVASREGSLKVGYGVALTLAPGVAPMRCYVGEVGHVDEHGLRVTLIDWFEESFSSNDLFVPWRHVECALVATGADWPQVGVPEGQGI